MAAIAGMKLVSVGWFAHAGVDAYDEHRYGDAEAAFERLTVVNVVERWKAPFDVGDARAAVDDLAGAEAAFRTALRLNPGRCETRFNLAATVEAIGDDLTGGARNPDVRARYEDALSIVEAGDCPTSTEAGHRLDQLADRLRQKLSRSAGSAGTAASNGVSPPVDRAPEADPGQFPSGNQQSQIQQRNQTGAAERRDRQETISANPGDPGRAKW